MNICSGHFFITSFNFILPPQRTSLWTSVSKMMQRAAMHFAASWKDATGGPGSQHSLSALHLRTVQKQGALAATFVKIVSAERSCKYTHTHDSTSSWETWSGPNRTCSTTEGETLRLSDEEPKTLLQKMEKRVADRPSGSAAGKTAIVRIHCHTRFSFKSCPARDCHKQSKCVGHFVDSFVMSHIEQCIVACNSHDDCKW